MRVFVWGNDIYISQGENTEKEVHKILHWSRYLNGKWNDEKNIWIHKNPCCHIEMKISLIYSYNVMGIDQ